MSPLPTSRWRLNRAGIINVYQYENETLDFGGGRLLLRGVNGSGKTTAMNMFLPFLLTARLTRIDAAGEQSGILKSWMLTGRDDPQPSGYIWIEFEHTDAEHGGTRHLTLGCGIKANRAADSITTWWFVTDQRVGFDLALVEQNAAVSADVLRAQLGTGAVFAHDRRIAYRDLVRRELYGGADIDQFLALLNTVRNPRVGDRIDVDLPQHLVDALPQLSDHALDEAARPLDDLDEHRANVENLGVTARALDALSQVHTDYLKAEVGRVHTTANDQLTDARRSAQNVVKRERRERETADVEQAASELVASLDAEWTRLGDEIGALERKPAYEAGRGLGDLRAHAAELDRSAAQQRSQAEVLKQRLPGAVQRVRDRRALSDDRARNVNERLAELASLAQAARLSERPPPVIAVATEIVSGDVVTLAADIDLDGVRRRVNEVLAAATRRRHDVELVVERLDQADLALDHLRVAEHDQQSAGQRVDEATEALARGRAALVEAQAAWDEAADAWILIAGEYKARDARSDESDGDERIDRQDRRRRLADWFDAVVGGLQRADADAERLVADAGIAVDQARDVVAQLDARSEPDAPNASWQTTPPERGPVFADLVDFADLLSDAERAGLEAASEAAGLLSATIGPRGEVRAASGELLAVAGPALPDDIVSLASVLTVTVDVRTNFGVSADDVERVLRSIAVDVSTAGPQTAVIATDGSFRVGPLIGRHTKATAEFIGATARRATLARLRREAAHALAVAESDRDAVQETATATAMRRAAAEAVRTDLPVLDDVIAAASRAMDAGEQLVAAQQRLADAAETTSAADRLHATAVNEAARIARGMDLPADRDELRDMNEVIGRASTTGRGVNEATSAVQQALEDWVSAVGDWRQVDADWRDASRRAELTVRDHVRKATQLATLEDTIGVEFAEVVEAIEQSTGDQRIVDEQRPVAQQKFEHAIREHQRCADHLDEAGRALALAVERCADEAERIRRFLQAPGVLDLSAPVEADVAAEDATDGSARPVLVPPATNDVDGLDTLVTWMAEHIAAPERPDVTAESVRQSLKRRQASLAGGWDAQDRQPDPTLPVSIVVSGPLGADMQLHDARRAVHTQLATVMALLTRQQDNALRELLQGIVAQEVAERLFEAGELIDKMNRRMDSVTTSHGIGVTLRWSRRRDLDEHTARTADLLAKLPELRTVDEDAELREALAGRLESARRVQPDVAYRQLISEVLDYREWFDLAIMVRRTGESEKRLSRRTALSEGEKKLVTYQPLFAAVAASCDALGVSVATAPRFLLLDDAFAKVSEDNHAKLFGLLVDLDLDFVATSERLWGTHDTVPELAITEVVRDAEAGAILLEHARWDGKVLELRR